jgi:hypothetical protein
MKERKNSRNSGRIARFIDGIKTFVRRLQPKSTQSTTKNYEMDATTLEFFHGIEDVTGRPSPKCISLGQTMKSAATHEVSLTVSEITTETASSSGSDSSTGSLVEDKSQGNHDKKSSCCVDDYLLHSTDGDSFIDRYDMLVSSKNGVHSFSSVVVGNKTETYSPTNPFSFLPQNKIFCTELSKENA